MAKVVYIIPGLFESTKDKRYREILDFFKEKGFKTIPVDIKWRRRVMSDYVEEFLSQFNRHSYEDEVYLFGFSLGAMISFITSCRISPNAQFLCSLSPYFKEDLPTIKNWWKEFMGSNRVKDFNAISFDGLAKQVKCKTYIFAGTKEGLEVETRAKGARHRINDSELFMIDGAKHDISQTIYMDKLKQVIETACR